MRKENQEIKLEIKFSDIGNIILEKKPKKECLMNSPSVSKVDVIDAILVWFVYKFRQS